MIISQISGGLGNQLFQYAAGKALAIHHNVQLQLDISHFNNGGLRKFELSNFHTEVNIADPKDIIPFTTKSTLNKIRQRLFTAPHLRKPFKEAHFNYYKKFLQAPPSCYLKGNWQSEKYFLPIKNLIKTEFKIQPGLVSHLYSKAHEMKNENSVSVHIRRGDYLNPSTLEYHGVLPVSYYENAINHIRTINNSFKIYFFSDDINWIKSNLTIDFPHEFISGAITKNHYEDFYLMSQCRNNIIANSSFSWWCAWLNDNDDKMVIAPKKWFNKAGLNTDDIIPLTWIRI